MSIRSINKLLNHPGCVFTMTAALLITMTVGFLGMRGCAGNGQPTGGGDQGQPDKVVATVGAFKVSQNTTKKLADNFLGQQSQGASPSPATEFDAYGGAIDSQITDGITLLIAKKEDVEVTDADILKSAQSQVDMEIAMMKGRSGSKSDADFEKLFEQLNQDHLTVDQYKQKQIGEIQKALKDPAKRPSMAAESAPQLIQDVLSARSKPSDDVLRASYITITAQRILFKGDDIPAQVEAVKAAEGKQSFESLMDKYSRADTTKGKKEDQMTVELTQFELLNPVYAPLLNLKVGEISDALLAPDGTTIYKIQKIDHPIPKDFETNKKGYGDAYARQMGQLKYQADLDEIKKSVGIVWNSTAWKAAYEYENQFMTPSMPAAEKHAAVEAAFNDAKQAVSDKDDMIANKVAGLTMYVAVLDLIKTAGKDGPAKYREDHIAAIKDIADNEGTPDLFLELADACAAGNDGAGFSDALNQAANMNTTYDANGAAINKKISDEIAAHASLLSADSKNQIEDVLKTWSKTKSDQEKELAEEKKEEAANQVAEKAAFEKAQADAKKTGATSSKPAMGPNPSAPPPSGPPPAKKP